MSILSDRLKELRGSQSQREMADPLGIKYQQWAKYERGEVLPGAEIIKQICLVHACSADWLLGLPRGGVNHNHANAQGSNAIAIAGSNTVINKNGDCSKCKLMQEHIKDITGRK